MTKANDIEIQFHRLVFMGFKETAQYFNAHGQSFYWFNIHMDNQFIGLNK